MGHPGPPRGSGVNVRFPDAQAIAEGAELLRQGRLVVFPTETVYGLGANGLDGKAIERIFAAKGRPADNPVILHVADEGMARTMASDWSEAAHRLTRRFWPGPLTVVVPKSPDVPPQATGGLDTVALRAPDHPVARRLIEAAAVPNSAPSANRSGRPSPTRCRDALGDLGAAVSLYLDGGPTRIGVESTVVSLAGRPTLLRTGGIPREAIEALVGPLAVPASQDRALAPGMKYRHYAPDTPLQLASPEELPRIWKAQEQDRAGGRIAWVVSQESGIHGPHVTVVASRGDATAWAARLFALLRDLDSRGYRRIIVEGIPEAGLGAAVMDRLRKAAAG
jgi:L-threonylcarbamoyladenylate synthase